MDNVTSKLIDYLPSWMKVRKDENSNMAGFMDAIGKQFGKIEAQMTDVLNNFYIDSANEGIADYVYKINVSQALNTTDCEALSVKATYQDATTSTITQATSVADFNMATNIVWLLDNATQLCYIRREADDNAFSTITITCLNQYGVPLCHYTYNYSDLVVHHIWNAFDEIGLAKGLARLKKETNEAYRTRLKSWITNPVGPTKEGIIHGIASTLGINENQISINDLSNAAFYGTLLNADGSASARLEHYARIVNNKLANTWDNMRWDEAYWKALDDTTLHFEYLPHVWDTNLDNWDDKYIQSGVGHGKDLLVTTRTQESDIQPFTYYVSAKGVINSDTVYYPTHNFDLRLYAKGLKTSTATKVYPYKYTIVAGQVHTFTDLIEVGVKCDYELTKDISLSSGTTDSSLELLSANTILSPSTNANNDNLNVLKVTTTMHRDVVTGESPTLSGVVVGWTDQSNASHTITITGSDFDKADNLDSADYPRIHNNYSDTDTIEDVVQLLGGAFEFTIDTNKHWKTGICDNNCHIVDNCLTLI